LSSPYLRKVPEVHSTGDLHGILSANGLEVEALQAVNEFAAEFEIAQGDARPCIAFLYQQGTSSERNPSAFILALELKCLGIPETKISQAITKFNERLSRHLVSSEIDTIIRHALKEKYQKPTACKHNLLAGFCVGDICPWKRSRGGSVKRSVWAEITASGWMAHLRPPVMMLYMGLHILRMRRGFAIPDAHLVFSFDQLKQLVNVPTSCMNTHLQTLQKEGLITNLDIGRKREKGKRSHGTTLDIVWPLPPVRKF